jgi:hypothetical protein
MPTTLVSRVDLIQGATQVALDLPQVAGGYRVEFGRSRQPVRERDGEGAEILVYGLGANRRRLTISGTTGPLRLPPNLAALDLSADVLAAITWADGTTATALLGRTTGIEGVTADLIGGASSWSLSVEGLVTFGPDPVTGAQAALDPATHYALVLSDEATDTYTDAAGETASANWTTDSAAFDLIDEDIADRVLCLNVLLAAGTHAPVWPEAATPAIDAPCTVVQAPRSSPAKLLSGQALTAAWIEGQLVAAFGASAVRRPLWIMVDGTMGRTAVATGLDAWRVAYGDNWIIREVLCPSERWLRAIANAAAGVADCT